MRYTYTHDKYPYDIACSVYIMFYCFYTAGTGKLVWSFKVRVSHGLVSYLYIIVLSSCFRRGKSAVVVSGLLFMYLNNNVNRNVTHANDSYASV